MKTQHSTNLQYLDNLNIIYNFKLSDEDLEEIKNYSRGPNIKMNSKTLILIIMLIGVAMLGLFMIMFLPDILQMFSGGL